VSGTTRIPLGDAKALADELSALLAPYCERLEVAGSIRRRREDVGDVDLVCIPKIEETPGGLFGDVLDERDLLHDACCRLVDEGLLTRRLDKNGRPSWGVGLKRAVYRGLPVDIQAVRDVDTFGAWLLIRTGPADFNKAVVTPRSQGGLLPSGMQFKDGFHLYRFGGPVPTPDERDVFAALGLAWIAPEDRAGPAGVAGG
jgi:DNA polymerase/3'-5' exonuclease PolX